MTAKVSAGLVAVRLREGELEFFLVHPGGPFFRNKDAGAWGIPKGLVDPTDPDPLAAAKREFVEETGVALPPGPYLELGAIKQKGGKIVHAWAVAADFDAERIVSNTFELEWPPRSGRLQRFPEVDRAGWFDRAAAATRMIEAQLPLLDRAIGARERLF